LLRLPRLRHAATAYLVLVNSVSMEAPLAWLPENSPSVQGAGAGIGTAAWPLAGFRFRGNRGWCGQRFGLGLVQCALQIRPIPLHYGEVRF
jgi:hypothetical protein